MASSSRTMMGQYAGLVTRGTALILDIVIVSLAVITINWVISLPIVYFLNIDLSSCSDEAADFQNLTFIFCKSVNILWFLVTILTPPIYFAVLVSIAGQTVGKYLMGVRVVRMDGQRMTIPLSFLRWLGYFISAFLLGYGGCSMPGTAIPCNCLRPSWWCKPCGNCWWAANWPNTR